MPEQVIIVQSLRLSYGFTASARNSISLDFLKLIYFFIIFLLTNDGAFFHILSMGGRHLKHKWPMCFIDLYSKTDAQPFIS